MRIRFKGLLSSTLCHDLIARYAAFERGERATWTVEELLEICAKQVFTAETSARLQELFPGGFQVLWPRFDVVDASAPAHNSSTRWHLDGGPPSLLKLFVYLNPVAEHGGNTLVIDEQRTQKLRREHALPLDISERVEDVSPILERLGLDTGYTAYNLSAGDAILFNPVTLAHRCLAPKLGKKRYTICFTLTPPF